MHLCGSSCAAATLLDSNFSCIALGLITTKRGISRMLAAAAARRWPGIAKFALRSRSRAMRGSCGRSRGTAVEVAIAA